MAIDMDKRTRDAYMKMVAIQSNFLAKQGKHYRNTEFCNLPEYIAAREYFLWCAAQRNRKNRGAK